MSTISQSTWNNMPESEKDKIISDYLELKKINAETTIRHYEALFGKENLRIKDKIKTWEDVEKANPELFSRSNVPNPMLLPTRELRDKLLNKSIAMYKIAILIEIGYGGIISDEEWEEQINEGSCYYTIAWSPLYRCLHIKTDGCYKGFVSFHTKSQAEDFMSHPENVQLIRDFYMIVSD